MAASRLSPRLRASADRARVLSGARSRWRVLQHTDPPAAESRRNRRACRRCRDPRRARGPKEWLASRSQSAAPHAVMAIARSAAPEEARRRKRGAQARAVTRARTGRFTARAKALPSAAGTAVPSCNLLARAWALRDARRTLGRNETRELSTGYLADVDPCVRGPACAGRVRLPPSRRHAVE